VECAAGSNSWKQYAVWGWLMVEDRRDSEIYGSGNIDILELTIVT